jgi:hypothetical protein
MCESHETTADSRCQNVPADHLDRAWPGTDRGSMKQVAAVREHGDAGIRLLQMISLDCAVCRGVNSARMFLMVDYAAVRVIGGANVPTSHMRVDATWPLALLEIAGPRLSLRLRWPGRLFGAKDLSATPDELKRIYPVRRLMVSGVGFTDRNGRDFYFWTRKSEEVLHLLCRNGYSVTDTVEKPSKVWRGTP